MPNLSLSKTTSALNITSYLLSFYYLKNNYKDSELRELAHEDLAWQKARQRKLKGGHDTFVYDKEVLHYYQVLSNSLLTAMGIKKLI